MANNMYSFLFYVFLQLYLCQSLTENQPNVCRKQFSSELYCCFNFENKNESCIECEIGYSSREGKPCEPCEVGQYGYRCVEKCDCNHNMRCDNAAGCVNAYNATSTIVGITTGTEYTYFTTEFPTERNVETVETVETTSIYLGTEYHSDSVKCLDDGIPFSKSQFIITMGIVIIILVLYILIIHVSCFLMYKRMKIRKMIITPENNYDEIGTIHYDAVSISPITINDSTSSVRNSVTSGNVETNLHLEEISIDGNSQNKESSEESQDDVANIDTNGEYLDVIDFDEINEYIKPYTPLVPSTENEHQYNLRLINRDTNSGANEGVEGQKNESYVNLRI